MAHRLKAEELKLDDEGSNEAKDERVFMSLGSRENAVRTPFGATTFNDESATRKTIEFTLSPEQHKQFQDFDEWAIEYLSKNSERLLKKPMNQEQIKQLYKSPVTSKTALTNLSSIAPHHHHHRHADLHHHHNHDGPPDEQVCVCTGRRSN